MAEKFFVTGSLGVYWYLLAVIFSVPLIFVASKYGREKILFIISIVFFAVGSLYAIGKLDGTYIGELINLLFGSERNFVNIGLVYIFIGYLLNKYEQKIKLPKYVWGCIFIVLILLDTILTAKISGKIFEVFLGISLFQFAKEIDIPLESKYGFILRKLSTVIYLTHFPIILLFDYTLKRGTIIDFSFVIICSIIIYIIMNKFLKEKYKHFVLG